MFNQGSSFHILTCCVWLFYILCASVSHSTATPPLFLHSNSWTLRCCLAVGLTNVTIQTSSLFSVLVLFTDVYSLKDIFTVLGLRKREAQTGMKTLRVMLSIDTDSKPTATTKPRAASVTIPLLELMFGPKILNITSSGTFFKGDITCFGWFLLFIHCYNVEYLRLAYIEMLLALKLCLQHYFLSSQWADVRLSYA